jgi:ribonuclease D
MGRVPTPLFDTQIAAMVCGFGDQVGYETLAKKLARATIDKSSRFTDWSLRPLTDKQLNYALSDVTHLRPIYEKLVSRLEKTGRAAWLAAEMEALAQPSNYQVEPREAWRRLRVRSPKPRFLAVLREVAAWREGYAQEKNVPRNRIVRDEAVVEIAAHTPATVDQLARVRSLSRKMAEGHQGKAILDAVARGMALPADRCPEPDDRPDLPRGLGPVVDLLKVLLKMKCEEHDVAQRLVASSADLELIAADDDADVLALKGWRRELFGADALALKQGRLALTVSGQELKATPFGG